MKARERARSASRSASMAPGVCRDGRLGAHQRVHALELLALLGEALLGPAEVATALGAQRGDALLELLHALLELGAGGRQRVRRRDRGGRLLGPVAQASERLLELFL